MKFLHISDLHLGKKVGNFSMLENQVDILQQVYDILVAEKPDALLISGDIYDKPVPTTDAVSLFDDFLVRLSKIKGLSIFIISGNHDSSERIAFGGRILDNVGIHLSPVYSGKVEPTILQDQYGPVAVYMLPFLRTAQVCHFFPEDKVENYTDAVSRAVAQFGMDTGIRNVLLSHQAVIGSIRCEAEVNIGGLDNIAVDPYMDFDYVALGHIHTPQNVKANHIRYCGSPLKYTFDECDQEKSVTIVELGQKGCTEVRAVPLVPKYDFVRIEGLFEDICGKYRGCPLEDYTEVILKDEMDVPDAFRQLQNYFPRLMKMRYDNARTREKKIVSAARDVRSKTAIEIFSGLFEMMNNQPLTAEQSDYLDTIIREIEEGQV